MKSIYRHLLGALFATATSSTIALVSTDVAAQAAPRPVTQNQIGAGIARVGLSIQAAFKLGLGGSGDPLDLSSDACGELDVTTLSTCAVAPDATCLASCTPQAFAPAAYDECASACDAHATEICKLGCNPACKFDCVSDDAFDPVAACEAGCSTSCGADCVARAQAGELSLGDCEAASDETCSSECAAAASVAGVKNCGVQCGASCEAQCTATANMDCQIACQVDLYDAMNSSCTEDCDASSWLYCDGKRVYANDVNACIAALVAAGVPVATE